MPVHFLKLISPVIYSDRLLNLILPVISLPSLLKSLNLLYLSAGIFCDLDTIFLHFLKLLFYCLPTLTEIIYLSLSIGIFLDKLRTSTHIHLLKKFNLNKVSLSLSLHLISPFFLILLSKSSNLISLIYFLQIIFSIPFSLYLQ
jgi:hypothetical protein